MFDQFLSWFFFCHRKIGTKKWMLLRKRFGCPYWFKTFVLNDGITLLSLMTEKTTYKT